MPDRPSASDWRECAQHLAAAFVCLARRHGEDVTRDEELRDYRRLCQLADEAIGEEHPAPDPRVVAMDRRAGV